MATFALQEDIHVCGIPWGQWHVDYWLQKHCMDCVFYVYMNVLKHCLYGVSWRLPLIALEGSSF